MSRLRVFNDLVNNITTEEKANELVKVWLPKQANGIDKGSLGCKAGVQNCSLIAEFVVTYMHVGVVDYATVVNNENKTACKQPYKFPFTKRDKDVFYLGVGGHDMALIREGNTYALYQAWEDKFHLFPKLNDGNKSQNIFGEGAATLTAICKKIQEILEGSKPIDVYLS